MRNILLALLLTISFDALCQKGLRTVSVSDLSSQYHFRGNFLNAVEWNDSEGKNLVILSQTDVVKSKSAENADENDIAAENKDKEIYAIHYLTAGDSVRMLWKLIDFERECAFDLTADYLTTSPVITDLDHDNICEVWIIYWLGCRSDVSPNDMKLILHIGSKKYAIRGERKIQFGIGNDQTEGGSYKMDDSFKKLPKIISDYAITFWGKYGTEIIGID